MNNFSTLDTLVVLVVTNQFQRDVGTRANLESVGKITRIISRLIFLDTIVSIAFCPIERVQVASCVGGKTWQLSSSLRNQA